MRLTCVAVVNQSRMFRGARAEVLDRIVQAVQTQVERDFCPAWNRLPLAVLSVPDGDPVPMGAALVYLVDKITDVQGAVGYHKADERGFFCGFVAVEAIARLGGTMVSGSSSVSVALSHEVLELLGNPAVNLWADCPDGRSIAHEVCDPVSGDYYDIEVEPLSVGRSEKVSVSNFVYPDWFNPHVSSGCPLDHMQVLSNPFIHRSTGYAVTYDRGKERPIFGDRVPAMRAQSVLLTGRCERARMASAATNASSDKA